MRRNYSNHQTDWKFPTPLFLQRAQADQVITVYVWRDLGLI